MGSRKKLAAALLLVMAACTSSVQPVSDDEFVDPGRLPPEGEIETLLDLYHQDPKAAEAPLWKKLRSETLDDEALRRLMPIAMTYHRRELVDIARRTLGEDWEGSILRSWLLSEFARPDDVGELREEIERDNDSCTVFLSALGLVRLGEQEGLDPLLKNIDEGLWCADWDPVETWGAVPPEVHYRWLSRWLFEVLRQRFSEETILDALGRCRKEHSSVFLACLAGEIPGPAARGILIDLLKGPAGDNARAEAAYRLGYYPGGESVAALQQCLTGGRDPVDAECLFEEYDRLRTNALESLVLLEAPGLEAHLRQAVNGGGDAGSYAAQALCNLGVVVALPPDEPEDEGEWKPIDDPFPGVQYTPFDTIREWHIRSLRFIDGPRHDVIRDAVTWRGLWRNLRMPVPVADFAQQTAIVAMNPDPRPDVMSRFRTQVLGFKCGREETFVYSALLCEWGGWDEVSHDGTAWHILLVPRIRGEIRFVTGRGRVR